MNTCLMDRFGRASDRPCLDKRHLYIVNRAFDGKKLDRALATFEKRKRETEIAAVHLMPLN